MKLVPVMGTDESGRCTGQEREISSVFFLLGYMEGQEYQKEKRLQLNLLAGR